MLFSCSTGSFRSLEQTKLVSPIHHQGEWRFPRDKILLLETRIKLYLQQKHNFESWCQGHVEQMNNNHISTLKNKPQETIGMKISQTF